MPETEEMHGSQERIEVDRPDRKRIASELYQNPIWKPLGPYQVSSELFLDVVFTDKCNCTCPWRITRTRKTAREDRTAWETAVTDAFRLFDIRSVVLLGGEATIDPAFWDKLAFLSDTMEGKRVDRLILTTNGIRLRDPAFRAKLAASPIDAFNLSRMHYDQRINDQIFGNQTLTREEIGSLYAIMKEHGKTLRLNANVYRGNLDSCTDMERYVRTFAGLCDAVKFTPLMDTSGFDTVAAVRDCSRALSIPEEEIVGLWNTFLARHGTVCRTSKVLGFVDYAETSVDGQTVILKYAQIEGKYDCENTIPTLKIYPNECLSNEWSFYKDIRRRLDPAYCTSTASR